MPRGAPSPPAPAAGRSVRRFGVGRIAWRQLRARPALAVGQGVVLAAATTLVASVVLIQRDATQDGLRRSLSGLGQGANIQIEHGDIRQRQDFETFQRSTAARVSAELGKVVIAGAQFGRTFSFLRAPSMCRPGPAFQLEPDRGCVYDGMRSHVRLVAGSWPNDVQTGRDWPFAASARATDDLGTPLHVKVIHTCARHGHWPCPWPPPP